MDTYDKLTVAGVVLMIVANLVWWSFVGYVIYRVAAHFGIL